MWCDSCGNELLEEDAQTAHWIAGINGEDRLYCTTCWNEAQLESWANREQVVRRYSK